jgi:ketosteroid isomerase-like protein
MAGYHLNNGGRSVAKFNMEQAVAVAAVQQLINDWAHELDVNNGLHIASLVTEDCVYAVGGASRQGRPAVEKFYQERLERLSARPEGVPTQRHTLSNLRVTFHTADEVSITFSLVYFTTAGMASGLNHADPAAVADVRMKCRRGGDGQWQIAMFDSNQTFRRLAP